MSCITAEGTGNKEALGEIEIPCMAVEIPINHLDFKVDCSLKGPVTLRYILILQETASYGRRDEILACNINSASAPKK